MGHVNLWRHKLLIMEDFGLDDCSIGELMSWSYDMESAEQTSCSTSLSESNEKKRIIYVDIDVQGAPEHKRRKRQYKRPTKEDDQRHQKEWEDIIKLSMERGVYQGLMNTLEERGITRPTKTIYTSNVDKKAALKHNKWQVNQHWLDTLYYNKNKVRVGYDFLGITYND